MFKIKKSLSFISVFLLVIFFVIAEEAGPEIKNFRLENNKFIFDANYIYSNFYIDGKEVIAKTKNLGGAAHTEYEINCQNGILLQLKYYYPNSSLIFATSYNISSYNCGTTEKLPDLVITKVDHIGILDKESGDFELPKIKFLVTVRNSGNADAFIKNGNYFTQISFSINGKLVGSPSLVDRTAKDEVVAIRPGEKRIVDIPYYESDIFQALRKESNELYLYVDEPFSSYTDGLIQESDENNNKFTYEFNVDICRDSEDGFTTYKKGTVSLYGIEVVDKCNPDPSKGNMIEYSCDGSFKVRYGYIQCPPNGCVDGICIGANAPNYNPGSNTVSPIILAVWDKSPNSDVQIMTNVIQSLKGNGYGQLWKSYLFSEVLLKETRDAVILAIKNNEAVIITSDNPIPPALGIKNTIISSLSGQNVKYKDLKFSEVHTDNLNDLFPEVELDKCKIDNDCNDENACTRDSCSGSPKKCFSEKINIGCSTNNSCIPIGTRIEDKYCDIDASIKPQQLKEGKCNNNYECKSNLCINDSCIEPSFIQKILNWFRRLFS